MSRSATPPLPLHNAPSTLKPEASPAPSTPLSKSSQRSHASQTRSSSYALLRPEQVASQLSTSLSHGLSPRDAEIRLNKNGPNELPHEEPEPLWLRFLKQFKETLIILLLASAAVSLALGNLEDAVSIAAAVTIVVTVGFVQEYRSEKSLEALNRLVPHYANLIRGGSVASSDHSTPRSGNSVPAEQFSNTVSAGVLVPGDLVSFYTGDRVPADVRITHAADLSIDESNLTGENEPVSKSPDALDHIGSRNSSNNFPYASEGAGTVGTDLRLNEQSNIAFMGTLVRSGYGHGIVIGTGGNTEFGAVSSSLQEIESPRTPLQLSMDRLGKDLSYVSFGVIGVIMLVGLWRGWEYLDIFQTGVSLAVAAIPEGLPIIVTVTLALGVFRMSKRHAIVKRLPSVETLGSVNVICSDKTGTLTMNHMTVTKLWHMDSDDALDTASIQKSSSLDSATRTILRIGNVANNGRLSSHGNRIGSSAASSAVWASTIGDESSSTKSRWLGQPTDVAMLDLLDALGEDDIRERLGSRQRETPFSSERKWMGVTIQSNSAHSSSPKNSNVGYIKGAIEQVLRRCDSYTTSDGREVVFDEASRKKTRSAADSMASEGLRVLGFASGSTSPNAEDPFQSMVFAGLVGMSDPPRKDVSKSIRRLMAGGVKVIMITGDAETTAMAISKSLGLPVNPNSAVGKAVIRGDELDKMSSEDLAQSIATTSIFARTSPDHKMKIIRALQARGDVVAMTGDGVNDAPALKKADIGVSMGRLGTDVAKEAADMILTDDDFSTILNAIEEGKGIFSNIQNFLTFQLSTSAAALSLVFISTFLGFPNPLNAMQILWINILMDGPPAQSLGVEPVDPAVMTRPPRSKRARVLTRALIQRVLQSASVIMLGTLLTYIYEMNTDNEVTARDTTMTFTCFVLFDMFNALTCRSEGKSVLQGEIGLLSNCMFNYAVGGSLLGQAMVIYFPLLQRVFQTEALGLFDIVRLLVVASSVFWVDEGRKFYRRRQTKRGIGGYSASV
ncbi:MAG: High affinity Ca2+/Mn2+ P-type ATPase-like protein [Alyxoria varia]|nr:MAG: High affinity Ca2+/Mn2+ P-type ATPase-like protein [Alyxoria varia]